MQKSNRLLNFYGRVISTVILMSLLMTFQVFGEQQTEPSQILNENETRFYSDLEVDWPAELDLLIDEISEAALEAIEQAAGEAARAAVLSMLEREAMAFKEVNRWRVEAERFSKEISQTKRNRLRNIVITGLVCFTSGLLVGAIIR